MIEGRHITKVSELPTSMDTFGTTEPGLVWAIMQNAGMTGAATSVVKSYGTALKWGAMAVGIDRSHNWDVRAWVMALDTTAIRNAQARVAADANAQARLASRTE